MVLDQAVVATSTLIQAQDLEVVNINHKSKIVLLNSKVHHLKCLEKLLSSINSKQLITQLTC